MTVAEREDLLTLPQLRAVQLLEDVAGDQSEGYIEIRFLPLIPGAQNQRFFCVSDPGSLLDAVDLASRRPTAQTGVYVGAAPRVPNESGELGGTAQHVERCHVLLADLDDDEALDAYSRSCKRRYCRQPRSSSRAAVSPRPDARGGTSTGRFQRAST